MSGHAESAERRRAMLRTAMGPAIAAALTDPDVIEVMVNPDGALRLDRLGQGRVDTGRKLAASETERIIRLVAAHVGNEVHADRPIVSAGAVCLLFRQSQVHVRQGNGDDFSR